MSKTDQDFLYLWSFYCSRARKIKIVSKIVVEYVEYGGECHREKVKAEHGKEAQEHWAEGRV